MQVDGLVDVKGAECDFVLDVFLHPLELLVHVVVPGEGCTCSGEFPDPWNHDLDFRYPLGQLIE